MSLFYLDKGGLTALWAKIKAKFVAKITQNGSTITPTTDSDGFVTYDINAMPDNISTTTTLANGDGIIFADSSDSNKLKRSSISFDGSTTTKALTQKGTWGGFVSTSDLPLSIANGGTGKTSRLEALKALTNEGVGTDADYFLTITTSWGKGGYTSVADAKTVLGLGAAAYKSISSSFSANQTGLVQANTIYNNLWYKAGDTIPITNMVFSGYITNSGKDIILYIPVAKPIATGVTAKVDFAKLEVRGISGYVSEVNGKAFPNRELTINGSRSGFIFKYTHSSAYATTNNTPITARAFDDGSSRSEITLKSS